MSIDWNDLYRSTFPDLVRFLHRKVWDADRATDLAQEAFVRALAHEPKKPRAWLFQVAANLAKDEARTAIRRKKHLVLLKAEAEVRQEATADPAFVKAAPQSTRLRRLDETRAARKPVLRWRAPETPPEP